MTRVFHRNPKSSYPKAVRGEGAYIFDETGKSYLDASGGAAVSCLGHSDPAVIAAISEQMERLPFAHTGFFTTEPLERLADRLVADAPDGITHAYFVSGGSEAIEAALKMARQYFVEIGEEKRRHVVARRQSYHGNTLGALATGGNAWRRAMFEPLLIDVAHVSPAYAYREQGETESEEAFAERLAGELEDTFQRLGPDSVIAFVAETVVGATLGAVPPPEGYFQRVREVCDRHGVLLILDEVMCGMGRTGTLYACEQDGVSPDIVAIAKGLGAGYQPVGAALASGRIYEAIVSGSGFFQHGHTYIGHAAACAGALAVQEEIAGRGLVARARALGEGLEARLTERFGNSAHVGDIRGRGLFRGLELVADRPAKTPFDPSLKLHSRVKARAMEEGLMCYPMGGTLDGRHGDHILLAPPFILEDGQLDELVDKLGRAVDGALEEVAA